MNKDTSSIIKLIKMLDGFSNHPLLRNIRLVSITERHIQYANIPYPEAISAIQKLTTDKYITKLTTEETDLLAEKLDESLNEKANKEIAEGLYTEDKLIEVSKNMLTEFGISIDNIQHENGDKKASEILNDNRDIKGGYAQELFLKAPLIGNFYINKDIYKLLEVLEKGTKYEDIEHDKFPYKLTFDNKQSILYIDSYGPITISKNIKSPNKGHYLLEYIFKNGIKEVHQYIFMHKEELFSKPQEKYNEKKHSNRYRNTGMYINKKIKESCGINNFLSVTNKSVRINPEFV